MARSTDILTLVPGSFIQSWVNSGDVAIRPYPSRLSFKVNAAVLLGEGLSGAVQAFIDAVTS